MSDTLSNELVERLLSYRTSSLPHAHPLICDEAAVRIQTLESDKAMLREALAPFAKAGSIVGERSPYGDFYAYRPAAGEEYAIFGDHLRAALNALTSTKDQAE